MRLSVACRVAPAAPLLLVALLIGACGSGAGEGTPSPTPSPVATAATYEDIRDVDFSQVPQVEDLLAGGGEVLPETVVYTDLTGDGQDEAVVPISSGGTAGDIAFAVFTLRNGVLDELLAREPGQVAVDVEDGQLVETQPIFGPNDPNCCPSQLKKTYYRWDGDELVVDHEETINQPPQKD
jgi:hypothetical protein